MNDTDDTNDTMIPSFRSFHIINDIDGIIRSGKSVKGIIGEIVVFCILMKFKL